MLHIVYIININTPYIFNVFVCDFRRADVCVVPSDFNLLGFIGVFWLGLFS